MAGNLKQRLIKAGRDYNYAEGVKVLASEQIYTDQVVYVMGSEGPFLKVAIADADAAGKTDGRMLIAKHDIPANGYGVCLPWKLVKDFDTSAAAAVGSPVYISATPGTARASNLTFTAPAGTNQIIVGRVTIDDTVANGGAMYIAPSAPEEAVVGGSSSTGGLVSGRSVEQLRVVTAGDTANIDFTLDYAIIVTDVHTVSAGASTGANATVQNGTTDLVTPFAFGSLADITRAGELIAAQVTVAAGATLRVTKSAAGVAGDVIVVTFIRA